MPEKGDTVQVALDIAKDGSGYSLSGKHSTMDAIVVKPPSETHWGKYHLIVPMDVLESELEMSESEIRDTLILREEDVGEGFFVASATGYVTE